jgi:signal transduction histidine kinase
VERALLLVENQINKAGVRVTTDFPEVVRAVNADEQQLHQVFLNLLLNAIEALRESAERNLHIVMAYDRTHLRPNNGPAMLDVECARVMISDTGCGIPRDQVEQVFTPFFTTKANGSGLGLAVVHGIVSGHHGEIDVSSIAGVGTIITLTLPLHDSVKAAEHAGA